MTLILTWVASIVLPIIINKLWALASKEGLTIIQSIQAYFKRKREAAANAQRVTTLQTTLQNGATEQAQIDASLDVLNGTNRTDHH